MDKTEFLKQAKAKYKDQIKMSWLPEMNFIYSNKLILRVWFDTAADTYMSRWCSVATLPIQKEQKIGRALGRYTSNDEIDFPQIIKNLKKALKENPQGMVDYLEGVNMWEKVELSFTVQSFCDLIGITIE